MVTDDAVMSDEITQFPWIIVIIVVATVIIVAAGSAFTWYICYRRLWKRSNTPDKQNVPTCCPETGCRRCGPNTDMFASNITHERNISGATTDANSEAELSLLHART